MFALQSTTFTGCKVVAKTSMKSRRSVQKKVSAKYGDESVYFDLGDVESTTGAWDVYGVESSARYPDQQAKFFENAAQGLGRREAMYSFLTLSGGAACLVFGGKGAKDAKLPITVGPQKEAVKGPRDRL
jgi:photosystem I subunit 6